MWGKSHSTETIGKGDPSALKCFFLEASDAFKMKYQVHTFTLLYPFQKPNIPVYRFEKTQEKCMKRRKETFKSQRWLVLVDYVFWALFTGAFLSGKQIREKK